VSAERPQGVLFGQNSTGARSTTSPRSRRISPRPASTLAMAVSTIIGLMGFVSARSPTRSTPDLHFRPSKWGLGSIRTIRRRNKPWLYFPFCGRGCSSTGGRRTNYFRIHANGSVDRSEPIAPHSSESRCRRPTVGHGRSCWPIPTRQQCGSRRLQPAEQASQQHSQSSSHCGADYTPVDNLTVTSITSLCPLPSGTRMSSSVVSRSILRIRAIWANEK